MNPLGRQRWLGPAMFLPAILYVVALVGVPFVLAFYYAVGDVKVGSVGYHFVGLANFESVLQSPAFRRALRNSFVFTISSHSASVNCAVVALPPRSPVRTLAAA